MNARAYLAVRDFGNGVKVEEVVKEGSETDAARDAGYTLTPLVPVSGEHSADCLNRLMPDGFPQGPLDECCTPVACPLCDGHPPHALAATQAEVKRLRELLAYANTWIKDLQKRPGLKAVLSIVATEIDAALSTPADTSELDRLVADAGIVRGMEALTNIGWAPELLYDDNGHWKVQADTFCELPWSDSPLDAWNSFVERRLRAENEIPALAAIDAVRAEVKS